MMRKILSLALVIVFISTSTLFAAPSVYKLSTQQLADRMASGQTVFNRLTDQRDKKLAAIMSDPSLSSIAKQNQVRDLQEHFLKRSRELYVKYRKPFLERVIGETNKGLPKDRKIKATGGTDIYLRDPDNPKRFLTDGRGQPIINPEHRGWAGDLDLGGDPQAVKKLETNFQNYGVDMASNTMDAPGSRDFGSGEKAKVKAEVTINVGGEKFKPGTSAHQTQVQMDAFSKETYASHAMKKNQPGRKLVEVNDHIKKGVKGFTGKASDLVNPKSEKALQGVSKATLKSIDIPDKTSPPGKVQHVSDDQLKQILKQSGYDGDVPQFKKQLIDIKQGHIAPGVGLNKENAKAFQEACKKTTDQAVKNAKVMAAQEFKAADQKIKEYEKLSDSPDVPEDQKKWYKKQAQELQENVADSKVRVEQTTLANQEKMKGNNYDDFYKKEHGIKQPTAPSPKTPPMSRVEMMKKGLKPDGLSLVGYGLSVYNTYDTLQQYKNGTLSKSDAAIGVTREVIDTGFGIVTDVAMAGAVTSGTAGALVTVAAPLIVFMASSYAISQAAEDGLKMAQSFEDEKIMKMIAKSKTEETINTLQETAEEMIKGANATGDWRYFAKADDIIYALEKLHEATGDDFYWKRANQLAEHVDKNKDALMEKYGCDSIYEVRGKVIEEERAEFKKKQQAELGSQKAAEEKVPASSPAKDSDEPKQASAAESDFAAKGEFRVQAFHNELAMAIGPNDASRAIWGPVQKYMLGSLQKVMRNKSEVVRIGKLSDAEWENEKAEIRKIMGQNLVKIASGFEYDPAYENLLNNWAGSGYISHEEADAAIANMEAKDKSDNTKTSPNSPLLQGSGGSIVDYFYIEFWSGNFTVPIKFSTIPVSYGTHTQPVSIQGKSLYTGDHDQGTIDNFMEEVARYKDEDKPVRYDVYPGKAELKDGKVIILSKADNPINKLPEAKEDAKKSMDGFPGTKGKPSPKQAAFDNACQTAVKRLEALKPAKRAYEEWQQSIYEGYQELKQQINAAAERGDEATYNKLRNELQALIAEEERRAQEAKIDEGNRLLTFLKEAASLLSRKDVTREEAHEFMMNSGMAEELGYEPPQ